ncbi:MAG TPA: LacI family DNA-binding transcriptional regulator [Spirochaetales bacterium]|nr:LacI family DNA-binding transcriptional regulator [Spirochaetales bacterium]HRY54322.1 LacI family DNA-binding transcriptional regulator [Spirochaetia bacterium]HRZ65851.1 LacI family DNA-binding transcriptional regulator [Spirochaetia bacterium]
MKKRTLRVTIKDIAAASGLSIASISRFLNGLPVRADTAARIEAALAHLDYSPNAAALYMKGRATGIVGLILPEISHPFFSLIAEGAIEEARKNDQLLLLSSTEGSRENERIAVDQFARSMLDGLVYIPVSNPADLPALESFKDLPLVVAGRVGVFPGVPHVYSDGDKGGYLAAKYLIGLGRRNIGFFGSFWEAPCTTSELPEALLTPNSGSYSTIHRFKGYLRALREEGIPYDPARVVICGYGYTNGAEAARELLGRAVPVDGLLAMTSIVAGGGMEVFRGQGRSVPEDISIIVFDDSEIMNMAVPRLTSVQLHLRRMGVEAVRSLNRLIAGEEVGDTMLDVSLKLGGSTRSRT